jgi:hypothetical protein
MSTPATRRRGIPPSLQTRQPSTSASGPRSSSCPSRSSTSSTRAPCRSAPGNRCCVSRRSRHELCYLVYLSVVGGLGTISWLSTIWAVKAGKRWARAAATALFVLGTSIALTDLLIRDTSGDTGLPPGWVGMLPCLAGLFAVTLLWRRS